MPHKIKCIDEKPWGDFGIRKIRVKNYYIYFLINQAKSEVQIISVIYVKRNQEKELEDLIWFNNSRIYYGGCFFIALILFLLYNCFRRTYEEFIWNNKVWS